jgi:hypothetical protein
VETGFGVGRERINVVAQAMAVGRVGRFDRVSVE